MSVYGISRGQTNPVDTLHPRVPVVTEIEVVESFGAPEKIGNPKPVPKDSQYLVRSGFLVYPIEALTPFASSWTIKARVTRKSDIQVLQGSKDGQRGFSVRLADESGEIEARCFDEQCDRFYNLLCEGCTYYITTPCNVSLARDQFTFKADDFELKFESGTVVEKDEAEERSQPAMSGVEGEAGVVN